VREAVSEDAALGDVVQRRITDLLPAVAESVSPPSGAWDVLAWRTARSPSSASERSRAGWI
jgi:hypothetical protein